MKRSREIRLQSSRVRFSVPKAWCNDFRLRSGDKVYLVIENLAGKKLFSGAKLLKSGLEIYGRDIRQAGIAPRQWIKLTLSDNQGRKT
jgi:hypothetical protein